MAKSVSLQAKMLASAAGKAGARFKAEAGPVDAVVVNGRELTRDQAWVLRRAAELAKGGPADRARAAAMVREVERDIAQAVEVEAVSTGVAETVELMGGVAGGLRHEEASEPSFVRDERGRLVRHEGELVVRVERVKRIRRDDGLANLLASGALTPEQFDVGQLYRLMSAKAAPTTGSSLNERSGGGSGGSSDKAVWAALDRAYAALRLRLVRTALADDRAFSLLDAVAGRGETIRSLGKGGRSTISDARKLAAALDLAGPLLRVSDAQLKRGLAPREQ